MSKPHQTIWMTSMSLLFCMQTAIAMEEESKKRTTFEAELQELEDQPATKKQKTKNCEHPLEMLDIFNKIASYLPIEDQSHLEQTNNKNAQFIRDSNLYKSLVYGWSIEDTSYSLKAAKDKFIWLKEHNPEYQIHLVDLLHIDLPIADLKIPDCHRDFLPLSFYGATLTSAKRLKYKSVYEAYLSNLYNTTKETEGKALLGILLYENNDVQKKRNGLSNILQSSDYLEETKAGAQYQLGIMDILGQGIAQPDYPNARQRFTAIITYPATPQITKASARYYLAAMDRFGRGILQPDYTNARHGFTALTTNPTTHQNIKAMARNSLAKMDRLGQGIPQPDYSKARRELTAVITHPTTSQYIKAEAQSQLAEIESNY